MPKVVKTPPVAPPLVVQEDAEQSLKKEVVMESPPLPQIEPPRPSIPPVAFKRNSYGLYEHTNYVFKEDGCVDWKAMIPQEFLVPNKDKTTETDVSKLEDHQILALLGGLKTLATLRGFNNVSHEVIVSTPDYVSVKTTIEWIPNYETDNRTVSFSSLADAHIHNCKSFAKNFLSTIAENRGFVRCVRNFLKINICGQDEIGGVLPDESPTSAEKPTKFLKELLEKNNITFGAFQNRMMKEDFVGAADWKSIDDIPGGKVFELMETTKKRIAEKGQKNG